jgi:hypothetical protein
MSICFTIDWLISKSNQNRIYVLVQCRDKNVEAVIGLIVFKFIKTAMNEYDGNLLEDYNGVLLRDSYNYFLDQTYPVISYAIEFKSRRDVFLYDQYLRRI